VANAFKLSKKQRITTTLLFRTYVVYNANISGLKKFILLAFPTA
jgi:hypothetical protein